MENNETSRDRPNQYTDTQTDMKTAEIATSLKLANPVLRSNAPLIELESVYKTYKMGAMEVRALEDINLNIDTGEYVAIMGQSGSGKSTLMHILGCLDVPTSGTYRLNGIDVGKMDDNQLAQIRNRQIGFVFQQFHLLPRLPAWKNVELPLLYAGERNHTSRREKAERALAAVGLKDRISHRPTELSGGQQQRVAIARALVTNPSIILADEPTGNLASTQADEIMGIFESLHQQGRTVIIITHEPDIANRAHRLVRIRDGHMLGDEVHQQ
jgi:putative ABC transport system ATP-binding protein